MNIFEKKETGEKLRYNREKLGYSEGEWAKLWKVSVADVRKWEKGISLPNSKKLDKLLEFSSKKSENKTNTKKSKVSKKARTYLITEEQLNKVKKEASDEAFNRMMSTMMYLPLKALSEMGWGKVRLMRF